MSVPLFETVAAGGQSRRDANLMAPQHFRGDRFPAPAAAGSGPAARRGDLNSRRPGGPQVELTSRTPSTF